MSLISRRCLEEMGVIVKPEMIEGDKAKENFERAMKAIFRVPKSEVLEAEKKYRANRKRKKKH